MSNIIITIRIYQVRAKCDNTPLLPRYCYQGITLRLNLMKKWGYSDLISEITYPKQVINQIKSFI